MHVSSLLFLFEGNMLLCHHYVAPCAEAGHPFLPVTALLGWKQVSHLMFSRFSLFVYLFSYFLPWYCTWPSHGLSRSSHKCFLLSGWQRRACQKAWWAADKHTYRRWHLLRRSPSEIVQILHIGTVTVYIQSCKVFFILSHVLHLC